MCEVIFGYNFLIGGSYLLYLARLDKTRPEVIVREISLKHKFYPAFLALLYNILIEGLKRAPPNISFPSDYAPDHRSLVRLDN